MTLNIRSPIQSKLSISQLRSTLERLRRRIDGAEVESVHEAGVEAMAAFKNFFMGVGEPRTEYRKMIEGVPPSSIVYNRTMEEIQSDLNAAYSEVESLQEAQAESFNFSEVSMAEISNRVSEATSKVVDLNLLNGLLQEDVLVGGDDFLDTAFIDTAAPLENPMADVLVSSGIVILKRTGSNNVVSVNTKVTVTPFEPVGLVRVPTQENENRFYEGNYYDYAERARPEGGTWHFETLVNEDSIGGPTGDLAFNVVGGDNQAKLDRRNARRASQGKPPDIGTLKDLQNQLDQLTPVPDPSDFVVIDLGASESELNEVRKNMLDGDPASFWESEYVMTIQEPLISKDDFLTDRSLTGVSDSNTPVEFTVDPNLLRQRAESFDREDLVVEIVFELETEQFINFLTLNPFNYGEIAWLDVLNIEIASSEGNFKPIPGLSEGLFDNTLTDEANEFLSDRDQSQILAPNKFAYKGKGVWSFPAQAAKLVRILIRQRTPVPDPYHRMHVLMTRVLQKTKVSASSSSMM